MKNKIEINNEVCDTVKPPKTDAIASRCLTMLLDDKVLNRKTLSEMDCSLNNISLNSIMSILRNERFIPIRSEHSPDRTSNYRMDPEEIVRYKDSELRKQQQDEMKILVEKKRLRKFIKGCLELLDQLDELPHLWRYLEELPLRLDEIAKHINALLRKRKGVL